MRATPDREPQPDEETVRTIVRMQFGSHLYGTNTETSDTDIKGVLVLLQGCCQDCFPEGVRNVSVTYSAGYASIPNAVKEAVLKAAALEAITATPSRHQIDGVKSLRILNYSVSYNGAYSDLFDGWKKDYEKAVDGFKRIYL